MLTIITTCVRYWDFLGLTLDSMLAMGDRVIVATSLQDRETIDLVEKSDAELFVTSAWTKDKAVFNKGAALQEAIAYAAPEWLLLTDADTFLMPPPPNHQPVDTLPKGYLYGAQRRMCNVEADWQRVAQDHTWRMLPLQAFPPVRGGSKGKPGRVWGHRPTANPIALQGYFQLWHYPTNPFELKSSRTAAKYDVSLALNWPDDKRVVIPWPMYTVVHLGPSKVNWQGRNSPRWVNAAPVARDEMPNIAKAYYG